MRSSRDDLVIDVTPSESVFEIDPDDEPPVEEEPPPNFVDKFEEAVHEELPTIKKELTWTGIKSSWKDFWLDLPNQIWLIYVDCLYVPLFRREWGKYAKWIPLLLPLRSLIAEEVKAKARAARAAVGESTTPGGVSKYSRYVPHDWTGCEPITINVAGRIFITQMRTLKNFPDSLLGNDAKRKRYYDPINRQYFIDRHASSFAAILHFFQTNGRELNRPPSIPLPIFEEEFTFYETDTSQLVRLREEEGYFKDLEYSKPKNLYQRKLHLLFEYPESSFQAKIVAIISVYTIVLSIILFCMETISGFLLVNENEDLQDPFFFAETMCMIWFCFEISTRLMISPSKIQFMKDFMNIIDFIAIIPYFFTLVVYYMRKAEEKVVAESDDIDMASEEEKERASLGFLTAVRLIRVLRIFKLSRHSKGLKILARTLSASIRELGLLAFFVTVTTVLFSSALYFAELKDDGTTHKSFDSIPGTFFFVITTMCTVGYGDHIPQTVTGRIVGSMCALVGVLTLALPVPVIVANFNYFYHRESDVHYEQCKATPYHYSHSCPDRPECETIRAAIQVKHAKQQDQPENMYRYLRQDELLTDEEMMFSMLLKGEVVFKMFRGGGYEIESRKAIRRKKKELRRISNI